MKTVSIVFPEAGRVALVESEVDEPGTGEVRCRALSSLVSAGTESFCLAGGFDPGTFWQEWVQYPFAPGYSMTAVATDIGPDVVGVRVGDRVATSTPHRSVFNVAATECALIPDSVTNDQACWMSLACTTQLAVRRADLALGETAVVVGLGILGQLVVQYLRLSGAGSIVVVDPIEVRRRLAIAGGATHAIADEVADCASFVTQLTAGAMCDVAFDVTGHPAVLAPTTSLVRPLGRVILLGDTRTPSLQALGPRVVAHSLTVHGVHASSAPDQATARDPWTLSAMTSLFFDFVSNGRMDVDSLTTHRFAPGQAADMYAALRGHRADFLGVYVDWPGDLT